MTTSENSVNASRAPRAPVASPGNRHGGPARPPARASRPRARNTGTTTTLPVSAAGSRLAASLAAARAAVASTPRTAATTLTRGPGFCPTTTHAGIDGSACLPARVRRRQRDGDGARLARRDRDATNPNTACGELDQHL